jgi:hypothetical protein
MKRGFFVHACLRQKERLTECRRRIAEDVLPQLAQAEYFAGQHPLDEESTGIVGARSPGRPQFFLSQRQKERIWFRTHTCW